MLFYTHPAMPGFSDCQIEQKKVVDERKKTLHGMDAQMNICYSVFDNTASRTRSFHRTLLSAVAARKAYRKGLIDSRYSFSIFLHADACEKICVDCETVTELENLIK